MAQPTYPVPPPATAGASNPYQSASLYVGDLAPNVSEEDLFATFNTVGPVASIRVCRDSQKRTSLGYAYVNFHTTADADRALDTMNFSMIKGKQCRIMWSQRDPSLRNSNKGNVFVKNLHETIDNKTLYDTFSVFGSILSCKVVTDHDTGKSKGYGYVHYTLPENAQKAIEGVDGLLIQGTKVTAELFRPRDDRIAKSEWTNVYIKFIPESWSQRDLVMQMEADGGGKITNSIVWTNPDMGTAACVNFAKHEAAKRLVEKYKGSKPAPVQPNASALSAPRPAAAAAAAAAKSGDAESKDDPDSKDDAESKEDGEEKEVAESGAAAAASAAAAAAKARSGGQIGSLYVVRAMKRKERDRFLKFKKKTRASAFRPGAYHCNLYVKNLDKDQVDSKELHSLFEGFGRITSARVMTDGVTKRSRGFGFVCFEKKEDAAKALDEMNGATVYGKKLYVNRAQKKQQRAVHLQRVRERGKQPQYPSHYQGDRRPDERPYHPPPTYPHMASATPYGMHPAYNPQFAQHQQQMAALNQFRMNPAFAQHRLMNSFMQPMGMPGVPRPAFPVPANVSIPAQPPSAAQAPAASAQMGSRTGLQQASVGAHSVGPAQPIVNYQSASAQVAPAPQQVSQSTAPGLSASQVAGGATGMTSVASQLSAPLRETQPLTPQMLKDAKPAERKRLIGERLFPKIQEVEPRLAGKITGMLLEMDNTELLILLDNRKQLMKKINEALSVLKDHQMRQSEKNQTGADSVIGRASAGNTGSVQHAQGGSQANA